MYQFVASDESAIWARGRKNCVIYDRRHANFIELLMWQHQRVLIYWLGSNEWCKRVESLIRMKSQESLKTFGAILMWHSSAVKCRVIWFYSVVLDSLAWYLAVKNFPSHLPTQKLHLFRVTLFFFPRNEQDCQNKSKMAKDHLKFAESATFLKGVSKRRKLF